MYNKLSDNLAITARVLEDVVRRFTAEEKKHISTSQHLLGSFSTSFVVDPADMAGGERPVDAADAAGGECQHFFIDKEPETCDAASLEDDIATQRNQALHRVDDDMRCLQQIYTDLANVAQDQQNSLDSIENHITSCNVDIERGREQISMAKYGWESRMKQKMMYVGGAICAVFLLVSLVAN